MPSLRKYKKGDRLACKQLILDRSMQNSTLKTIGDVFKAELGIEVSLPTISSIREEVQSHILDASASAAAECQIQVLEKLKTIDPGRFVDILNEQVRELHDRLYDPLYSGRIPAPRTLSERLTLERQLSDSMKTVLAIIGPPKVEAEADTIYKKDVIGLLKQREEQYAAEFLHAKEEKLNQIVNRIQERSGAEVPAPAEEAPK